MYRKIAATALCAVLTLSGCGALPGEGMGTRKCAYTKPDDGRMSEESMVTETTENVIYLAGGCFWGMEQLMQSIPGVIDAQSGYANGT